MLPTRKKVLKTLLSLLNHPSSPERVARGIAAGLFCAFVVPVFQMALALLVSLGIRGSRVPALLFTWVSNPFTIPVLFPLQCLLGSWLIGQPLTYESIYSALGSLIRHPTFSRFIGLSSELVFSFFAGGLVIGLICAVTGYYVSCRVIARFREQKAARRLKRKERRIAASREGGTL